VSLGTYDAQSRQYVNFDLVIERAGEQYRARVLNAPSGDAVAIFTTPFTTEELEQLAARLDNSRGARRRLGSAQLSAAKDAGGRLFRAVITPEVNASLYRAAEDAEKQGARGVRVRLHLDNVPELAVLPWELLFDPDPRVSRFLALAERTPLVRYMALPERVRPVSVAPPIRVLVIASVPGDPRYAELDLEHEWQRLQEAMADQITEGRVTFTRLPRATLSALQDELATGDYHVLHYMGHGQFDRDQQDGMLLFEAEHVGRAAMVSAETLGTLLHNARALRLVVINACEGARGSSSDPYAGTAQTLIRMGIPAVIGMQFEISDDAAVTFARQLYWTIARGWPIDAAVTSARIAMLARGNEVEWANPVLYMRASDGRIFDVSVAPSRSDRNPPTVVRDATTRAPTTSPEATHEVSTTPSARQARGSAFTIRSATNTVVLGAQRKGHGIFAVVNRSGRAVRVLATANGVEPPDRSWLRVVEPERMLAADATEPFTVEVSLPPEAPAGRYSFRLDVVSAESPDEAWARGPVIAVDVVAKDRIRPENRPGYVETLAGALIGALAFAAAVYFVQSGDPLSARARGDFLSMVVAEMSARFPISVVVAMFAPPIGAYLMLRWRGLRYPRATAVWLLLLTPVIGLGFQFMYLVGASWLRLYPDSGAANLVMFAAITASVAVTAVAARAAARWRRRDDSDSPAR